MYPGGRAMVNEVFGPFIEGSPVSVMFAPRVGSRR